MKQFLVPSLLLCLSFLFILSGFLLDFLNSYQNDRDDTMVLAFSTEKYYEHLQDNFEQAHLQMISMNDFFALYYEEAIAKMGEYEQVMDQIHHLKKQIDLDYQQMDMICSQGMTLGKEEKCERISNSYVTFSTTYDSLQQVYSLFTKQCQLWDRNSI